MMNGGGVSLRFNKCRDENFRRRVRGKWRVSFFFANFRKILTIETHVLVM